MTIDTIIEYEWDMFTNATNAGGRASCQDDRPTFVIMRRAQHEVWAPDTLESYLEDLKAARADGVNLVAIKYARMMEVTFPEEYEQLKSKLPPLSETVQTLAHCACACVIRRRQKRRASTSRCGFWRTPRACMAIPHSTRLRRLSGGKNSVA